MHLNVSVRPVIFSIFQSISSGTLRLAPFVATSPSDPQPPIISPSTTFMYPYYLIIIFSIIGSTRAEVTCKAHTVVSIEIRPCLHYDLVNCDQVTLQGLPSEACITHVTEGRYCTLYTNCTLKTTTIIPPTIIPPTTINPPSNSSTLWGTSIGLVLGLLVAVVWAGRRYSMRRQNYDNLEGQEQNEESAL